MAFCCRCDWLPSTWCEVLGNTVVWRGGAAESFFLVFLLGNVLSSCRRSWESERGGGGKRERRGVGGKTEGERYLCHRTVKFIPMLDPLVAPCYWQTACFSLHHGVSAAFAVNRESFVRFPRMELKECGANLCVRSWICRSPFLFRGTKNTAARCLLDVLLHRMHGMRAH